MTARDQVGNKSTAHGEIVIPAPQSDSESESVHQAQIQSTAGPPAPTADPPPTTPTPQPTEMLLAAIEDDDSSQLSALPESAPESPVETARAQPLWGAAAAAISYAAANLALSRRKKREEEKDRLRREVARANAGRSLERRLASIWKSVQPVVTAIAARQQAVREAIAAAEEQARQAAVVQAMTARWQALADHYETKAEQEAAAEAASAGGGEPQAQPEQETASAAAQQRPPDGPLSAAEQEPVLEQVPSFWSSPAGWLQANLINAGRQNDHVRGALVATAEVWESTIEPIGQVAFDFTVGASYQVVKNNAEPIGWVAGVLNPAVREEMGDLVERLEERRLPDSTAYRYGRLAGGLLGLAEAAVLSVTGATTTVGGAAACGTGVLCAAGAPAVAVGVSELAAAGAVAVASAQAIGEQVVALSQGSGRGDLLPNELTHSEWEARKPEEGIVHNLDGTTTEYEVRNSPGADGGWSRIVRVRDADGNTLRVTHEAWSGTSDPRVDVPDHSHVKFGE